MRVAFFFTTFIPHIFHFDKYWHCSQTFVNVFM